MATMSVSITNVRDAVLSLLGENELQPMEILTRLGQEGFVDSDIKQAISELIHEGRIELTSHRTLKVPAQSAA